TAERKLRALRQGTKSASAYHAEFVSLVSRVGWDRNSWSSFFKNGLREELKDLLLARDLPEDFNAFAQLCIKLDNAWHARQMEKKQSSSSRSAAPAPRAATSSPAVTTTTATTTTTAAPRTSTGTAPGPMELDASRHITPETRQYRKENGLCMYCGGQGHFASVCRNKKKPPRHTAAVATA